MLNGIGNVFLATEQKTRKKIYTFIHFSFYTLLLPTSTWKTTSANATNAASTDEMNSFNRKKICFCFRMENGKCSCLLLRFFPLYVLLDFLFCFFCHRHRRWHRYMVAVAAITHPTILGWMHCVANWQMFHSFGLLLLFTLGQITSWQCHWESERVQFSKCFFTRFDFS